MFDPNIDLISQELDNYYFLHVLICSQEWPSKNCKREICKLLTYILLIEYLFQQKFLLLLIVFSETIKNGFYTIKLNPRIIQYNLY